MLRFADRGNQGQQGSCVAWSCAYSAQTILTAAATGQDPNRIIFSPSYLYNQIKLEGCQGSYIQRAMESMSRNGGVPFAVTGMMIRIVTVNLLLQIFRMADRILFMGLPGSPMAIISMKSVFVESRNTWPRMHPLPLA